MEDLTYTCGAQLQDLDLSGKLAEVYIRDMRCYDPIEKLYYSTGKYEEICIYCGGEENLTSKEGAYPQCIDCSKKRANYEEEVNNLFSNHNYNIFIDIFVVFLKPWLNNEIMT